MQLRRYAIGLVAMLALLAFTAPAVAASGPYRYSPKHGHHCRRGYRRVRHHRKVLCIKRRRKSVGVHSVKLHAHLDPTYTRDPFDPFKVTYAYSASATQEAGAAARASVEEPAPLPAGVLAFYSDGKLECAENVGGAATGGECPVNYQALGEHRVTTIYSSGEQSATETEVENITPLATTTTLSVSYEPFSGSETSHEGDPRIGTLTVNVDSGPVGPATLECRSGEQPSCVPVGSLNNAHANGVIVLPVYFREEIGGNEVGIGPYMASTNEPPSWRPIVGIESGSYFLRATSGSSPGYASSEATAVLQFTPVYTP